MNHWLRNSTFLNPDFFRNVGKAVVICAVMDGGDNLIPFSFKVATNRMAGRRGDGEMGRKMCSKDLGNWYNSSMSHCDRAP